MNQEPGPSLLDDRFEFLSRLGEGGMGTVYLCRQKGFDRLVAVKVLHAEFGAGSDSDSQLRFEREAHALSALRHKSIVTIYAYGEYKRNPYMVMEYVDGLSLSSSLEKSGVVDPREVVRIASQICDALKCAHSNGVIHRDLKPNNILLSKEGDVKLIDFGLAMVLPNAGIKNQKLTEAGTALGTVLYMSPEQCVGEAADGRSDLYGLGCVMFHCLTGMPPFSGDHTIVVMNQHVSQTLPRLADVAPGKVFPTGLQEVLDSATAKEREDRYQSAQAMLDDLQRLSNNLPVKAEAAVRKVMPANHSAIRVPRKALIVVVCTFIASAAMFMAMFLKNPSAPIVTAATDPVLRMTKLQDRLLDPKLKGKERALTAWELADVLSFLAGERDTGVTQAHQYHRRAAELYAVALPALDGEEAVFRALQSVAERRLSTPSQTHLVCYAATVLTREASAEPNPNIATKLFHRAENVLQRIPTLDSSAEYINTGSYLYHEWASYLRKRQDWKNAERIYMRLDSACRLYEETHLFRAAALARLQELALRMNHPNQGSIETAVAILEDADPKQPGLGFYLPALDAVFDCQLFTNHVDAAEKALLSAERKIKAAKLDDQVNLDAMRARIAVRRARWTEALADLEKASRKSLSLHQPEVNITTEYQRAIFLTALHRPGAEKIIEKVNQLSAGLPNSSRVRRETLSLALVTCAYELAKQGDFAGAELILDTYGSTYPPSPDLACMLDMRKQNTFRTNHW